MNNVLNRNFHDQLKNQVVVSDLTYVRLGKTWNYICVLVGRILEDIL